MWDHHVPLMSMEEQISKSVQSNCIWPQENFSSSWLTGWRHWRQTVSHATTYMQSQCFACVMGTYQLGPWCGIAQTGGQNYFHCPSHQHPSGCWHHCTAVGFQYCRNLSLLLSSSWFFLIYSQHQTLLKILWKKKICNMVGLNNIHILEISSKVTAQDFYKISDWVKAQVRAQEQIRYQTALEKANECSVSS